MNRKIISNRVDQYKINKKLIESGESRYVPFLGFPKLQKYIPGVIPGIMYKVTSHMGVGKTKLSKYLFVYQTLLYALKYNIKFKVLYFALEESEEEFIDDLIVHLVRRLGKVQLDRFSLIGTSNKALKDNELQAVLDIQPALQKLMANIEVIDNRYTPTAMFNTCKYYAKKWGKFAKDSEGNDLLDSYTPNDPRQIVLVVADHISLLSSEYDEKIKGFLSDHKTISRWHTEYCRKIFTKAWKWSVLNIQQQSLESEKQQFTSKGETIINKILPTLDGLANNKEVGRDDYVVLGLFAPERYSIEKYLGYEIKNNTATSFGDRFRTMHLLKNRFGHPNKILPLYFDGRYTSFAELPHITDPKVTSYLNLLKT